MGGGGTRASPPYSATVTFLSRYM